MTSDPKSSTSPRISVVCPTYHRAARVPELLQCLTEQTRLPDQVIIVDGAEPTDRRTEVEVERVIASGPPFDVRYLRSARGTARQRNHGIDAANGDLIAFLDDDVRPEPGYLAAMAGVFAADVENRVGGVAGIRLNKVFRAEERARWRWYRRLRLLSTFEPGRYDFRCGYPINASMQPVFSGTREVDFMTTACAVWRRKVFERGLRFDEWFTDYGVLEDAHFALRGRREWVLLQCGDARAIELSAPEGRVDQRRIGYKSVVNYYYVFQEASGPLTAAHKLRFWRFQLFELCRMVGTGVLLRRRSDLDNARGRVRGVLAIAFGR